MSLAKANLFCGLPEPQSSETFEDIVSRPGCRIERIVSHGHASPPGFWYDQAWDEWVLVLQGQAVLRTEKAGQGLHLQAGDHCMIPAHTRHRVDSTDADGPTIWLAIHFDEAAAAGTGFPGVPAGGAAGPAVERADS